MARFQGGNNAGHTVVVEGSVFKLHHVPSGILYPGTLCLLGNGMVINPRVLLDELSQLEGKGIDTGNLRISGKAHLILDYHLALDEADEHYRDERKIGTTGRGIGPAYADKAYRRGIRMEDLVNFERFRRRLEAVLPLQNLILQRVYDHPGFDLNELLEQHKPLADRLRPFVVEISLLLQEQLSAGKRVLFEGAQGTLLDIDHGTYPYVTSSSTVSAAAAAGLGIGPRAIGEVLGVIKAYTTRVGEGPFPTEETGELGELLRRRGAEFGTTTGRPRRCGWFDGVVARYAARVNGLTGLAVTKLDILSGIDKLLLAYAYRLGERTIIDLPSDQDELKHCVPLYHELPGWKEDISKVRRLDGLPGEARRYLQCLEEAAGVKIAIISVGPEREQTILLPGSSLCSWR